MLFVSGNWYVFDYLLLLCVLIFFSFSIFRIIYIYIYIESMVDTFEETACRLEC